MDILQQIGDWLQTSGDKIWQEALIFISGLGVFKFLTNKSIIPAFILNTFEKFTNKQKEENCFTYELFSHLMSGLEIQFKMKAEDYQKYLDEVKEDLTLEEREKLENTINKLQNWCVENGTKYKNKIIEQIGDIFKKDEPTEEQPQEVSGNNGETNS